MKKLLRLTMFFTMVYMMLFTPSYARADESISAVLSKPESISDDTVGMYFKLSGIETDFSFVLQYSRNAAGPFTSMDSITQQSGNTYISASGPDYKDGVNGKSRWYILDTDEREFYFICYAPFGIQQYYRIAVYNSYDSEKLYGISNTVSVTAVPEPPAIISGYQAGLKKTILKWESAKKVSGYSLERKNGSKWKTIKNTSGKKTSFTDKHVKKGKTYYYRVRAYKTRSGKKIYSGYSNTFKITIKKSTVKGAYNSGNITYGNGMSKTDLQTVRDVVQSFKNNCIKKGMSDYAKVRLAFNYVRVGGRYSMKSKGFYTAWGALVGKSASCVGYAKGFKALCDGIGIPCKFVRANSKAVNPSHAWAVVKLSKKWYICDPQGGMFLVGSNFYNILGMTWDKKKSPKISAASHPNASMDGSIT